MKLLSIVTVLALVFFALFPEVDLKFSNLFFDSEKNIFPLRDALFSQIIYYSVRVIAVLTFFISLFVVIYDFNSTFLKNIYSKFFPSFTSKIRGLIKINKRQAMFLLLIILITPGILVHWVMKPMWERARPVNVQEFGGDMNFTNFYHFGVGQDGNSFPSGHASMAVALLAVVFLVGKERQRKVTIGISIYAVIASLCRVWQGGHFLTDIIFSAIITMWTILILKKYFLDRAS